MEFFYEVRIGTRTRAGNLNVLHHFVCKSLEVNEYKIRNYYSNRYLGLSVDVFKINEVVDIINEKLDNSDLLENNDYKSKIKDLEKEIKNLQESKNSTFSMERHCSEISEENKLLYNGMIKNYKIYSASVLDLENGIKREIIEKYSPFSSSINTDERMNGNSQYMKFRLNLKNKLF